MKSTIALTLLVCVAIAVGGCGGEAATGPPEIHYGRDACERCGMIISEKPYAAAMRLRENGSRRTALFDDIGEMFDFERSSTDAEIISRYVHDHESGEWIEAENAFYVHSETLQTPMVSGVAALASRDEAEQFAEDHSGEVLTFEQMRSREEPFVSGPGGG